jgi:hypothetical protein
LPSSVTDSPDWTRPVTPFFTSAIPSLCSALECPNLNFAHRLGTGNSALLLVPGPRNAELSRRTDPQREVSGLCSQDLGFRPSVFGSQDLGFRTSKALHPTVVLSFSRHFSLRPVVTDARTHALSEFIYKI